jgi:beta-lactamase regulating signal transducer with metallopeptidase domain
MEHLLIPWQNARLAAFLLDALLKSLVVLALAGGVGAVWRRASAATRHLIWFSALASLAVLPLINAAKPAWQKSVWTVSAAGNAGDQLTFAVALAPHAVGPAAATAPGAAAMAPALLPHTPPPLAAQFSASWLSVGEMLWLAGVAAVMTRLAAGSWGRRQFARSARPLRDPEWLELMRTTAQGLGLRRTVALWEADGGVMPMTWGWWHPVVLLPAEAADWSPERRRVVLLHELAHVQRRDYLTQTVAQLVCAVYWFNPLAWFAARQMCLEREAACDDLVLAGGCKASDYAGHLVDIAGSFRHAPHRAAMAMARPSQLAGRVAAIVDRSRNRRRRAAAALLILAGIGAFAVCLGGGSNLGGGDPSNTLRQQQIERLKVFSALKEKQSETLAAATGETLSPEFRHFFTAAQSGDWETVTNLFESFKQRHPQYSRGPQAADLRLRTSFWGPVLEICLAYEAVMLGEPAYTQMAVDDILHSIPRGSIYFGGTDPGRGLPTAFCQSQVDADPFYTLTQNALADGTYLDYLQRTYGDERALLGPLAAACRTDSMLQETDRQWSAAVEQMQALESHDNNPRWQAAEAAVNDLERKRDERFKTILAGVREHASSEPAAGNPQNAPAALYIPSAEDSQRCFQEYSVDVQWRAHHQQLKPGEDFKEESGRIQISGQVAVMQINGLLAQVIFDKNPAHEFFVEESWPLDWMYPRLEPHGLILKVNTQPLPEITDAMVRQDRDFWQPRVAQMIGGWLKEDTSIADIIAFDKQVYLRHDLAGFSGDPHFVQNEYAGRMFSKFRSAIAGLYAWRAEHAAEAVEKDRMARAADLAFRQALALCPHRPDSDAESYVSFLKSQQRETDARLVLAMAEASQATSPKQKPQP